jgi:hypothetical protein
MRVANCKTVCREIDESSEGQDLSRSSREHFQGCQRCQAFYEGRRELRLMLANLETVEAPPDFDFRVRSRLANQKARPHAGFFSGSRSFGLPVAVLATLVLVLGAGFAFRTLMRTTTGTTAVGINAPTENLSEVLPAKPGKGEERQDTQKNNGEVANTAENETREPVRERKRSIRPLRNTVASQPPSSPLAIKEFSSMAASVVKQDEAIASLETSPIFALEASSEPLKVSLDYDTGVSRTISLPALSFGSQPALTGRASSLVKTSAKGVW